MKNKSIETEEELRELEQQLSCPKGENGIEVGEIMNETNINMTLNSIHFLEIKDNNSILELGHGNCKHLDKILEVAKECKYFGLEVSETMYLEAQKNNSFPNAKFELYDGHNIPFPDNFFDRVISVNTIYFWSNHKFLINEIRRILKPDGICVLAYVDKELMKKLPFVGNKFTVFDRDDIERLVEVSKLNVLEFKNKTEQIKSKTGETIERKYTMVKISKNCPSNKT